MQRIVFRCDASLAIGSGHFMRCLTLAATLAARGAAVEFVCRGLPAGLRQRAAARGGIALHALAEDARRAAPGEADGVALKHGEWLRATQTADAADTLQVLRSGQPPRWLIVDHYALDARWERALRPHVGRLMAIDDLADRDHDCDVLLDQNLVPGPAARYAGRAPAAAALLLGPRYALLRPEFAAARARLRDRDGRLRRLLISFGAYDPANQTMKALRAVENACGPDVQADVVIGSDSPHLAEIDAFCRSRPRFRLNRDALNMAELMASADLAIGACGATAWERCCLKLPALLVSVAENQYPIAGELAGHGACVFLGRGEAVAQGALEEALRELAGSPARLRAMGGRAGELCDGSGAVRVANRLLPPPIRIRKAQMSDCLRLHEWRNAEEVRRFAFNTAPIAREDHVNWYHKAIENPDVALLIGDGPDCTVGVLRYDFSGDEARVSVYLVPGLQGRGLGTALLVEGTEWLRARHPAVRRIIAEVKPDNAASLGAFASAGFTSDTRNLVLDLTHEEQRA
jgi:UDP-2,4-diacetamido-2,4,6-trideoxy-beta-L-altropyranose hydrolase